MPTAWANLPKVAFFPAEALTVGLIEMIPSVLVVIP